MSARDGNGQAPQQGPGWRTFFAAAAECLSSLGRRVRGCRPTPTEWVALASLAVAIGAAAMYSATSTLRAWTPNIATDAFFVAVTITVVERAIRREARRRLQPRVESVMYHTRMQMKMFASSVVIDYSGTHLHTFRPVEQDMLAFLEQWLADQDTKDACSAPIDSTYSLVVHAGTELANLLREMREHDREVMEPDLVRAMDDFLWLGAQHGRMSLAFAMDPSGHDRPGSFALAEHTIVREAKRLAEVLLLHDDRGRITFEDLTLRAAEEHSRHTRERGWYLEEVAAQMRAERWRREHERE